PSAAAAPVNAVASPAIVTTWSASGGNRKWMRASRNTPAATIVAAWISADTGVGPAIATGSQVKRGNRADLAANATKMQSAAAISQPCNPWVASTVISKVPALR